MTAHHCTICLATKIPLVCMLFCVPSWIPGPSGAVAQVYNKTTQYTTLATSNVTGGLDPPLGGLHIHDHDGFQIKESSLHDVAREEGKYFVSLLFAKYGEQNQTLHRSELLELFHNLGLNRQNDDDIHMAETKHKSVHDETHKYDMQKTESLFERSHITPHIDKETGLHVSDKNSWEDTEPYTYRNLNSHSNKDIHLGKSSVDKNNNVESQEHASDKISSSNTENNTVHERNPSFNNRQNIKRKSFEQNGESIDINGNVAGGKKRQDNIEPTGKNERMKKKTKKQESVNPSSQNNKDISKRSVRHYHADHTKCLTITEILEVFDLENKDEITLTDFLYMSPAIIHQLDVQNCSQNAAGDIRRDLHDSHNDPHIVDSSGDDSKNVHSISAKVWGFSFAAVLVISLVGLLGVAVIPIMQKVFYNHLLQFLVALAVGALMGDALLHLLPHAIGSSELSHEHGLHETNLNHNSTIWKGLCGLMGIFFFFVMERVLTIITQVKRKKKTKHRLKQSPHRSLCKLDIGKAVGSKLSTQSEPDFQSCEEMVMVVHPNKSLKSYADETHDGNLHSIRECDVDHSKGDNSKMIEEEAMMTHIEHAHSHHGHSHIDGPMPRSVASIAWMVILGDGIHNFSDGLAIGAAFANSITGGFSTSIAVFCHELPHEIGDFAVLLRAGMSAKQAIVYNCVSSILCFVGMAIGVALGNIHDVTLWIFAGVGGIFIYIALVDMLPEMTSVETKRGENPFCHLLLQCTGMLTGSSIMLLIAVFEEDLLTALD